MSNIEVRIPLKHEKRPISSAAREFVRKKKIVSPGDVITEASDYMRYKQYLGRLYGYQLTRLESL